MAATRLLRAPYFLSLLYNVSTILLFPSALKSFLTRTSTNNTSRLRPFPCPQWKKSRKTSKSKHKEDVSQYERDFPMWRRKDISLLETLSIMALYKRDDYTWCEGIYESPHSTMDRQLIMQLPWPVVRLSYLLTNSNSSGMFLSDQE